MKMQKCPRRTNAQGMFSSLLDPDLCGMGRGCPKGWGQKMFRGFGAFLNSLSS